MVTLNHQIFWQPAPGASVGCSSTGSETQTIDATRRPDAPKERSYTPENNVLQEDSTMGFVSEPNELPRANSPDLYHNDELSTAGNYPDYPEEVALYPSSRVSDTPSVAGLEGPGTTRVFDVFEDDRIRQSDGEYYRNCAPKERKRALENSNTSPPKRRRYRTSTVTNANKPRGKRASPLGAGDPPLENTEGYSDSNLAGLRNAIGYLKRAYSLVTAEAKFSDDIAGADILKENLSVLQLATKTLQHAYGIIATSTTAMENVAREATTVQQRSTFTRSKWTVEDDHRLLRLRDSQNLSWSRIRDLFPERTMNAIRTRYSRESSKHSEPLSSKENHSVCTGRQVKGTSSIRRSPRLSRPRRVSDRTSNAERERRYPSRAAKHSSGSNALNLDSIDPRLRNINNV